MRGRPAAAAAAERERRERRREPPPIKKLQGAGLQLVRNQLQEAENARHNRNYAVYDSRFNRSLGQQKAESSGRRWGCGGESWMPTSGPSLHQGSSPPGRQPSNDTMTPKASEKPTALGCLGAMAPGYSGPIWTTCSKGNQPDRDLTEAEQAVVDGIMARFIHEGAYLSRAELEGHYIRVLPGYRRDLWLQLLSRFDNGGDADSTSGSSSSPTDNDNR